MLMYRGIDGVERPVPTQVCRKCGGEYQAHQPRKLGCAGCVAEYRAGGGYTAQDWIDAYRRGQLEQGLDPDACDCGQCHECQERQDHD